MTSKVSFAQLKVLIEADPKIVLALKEALSPESLSGKKCSLKVRKVSKPSRLGIEFASGELVPLRASLNTNLRLLSSALRTIRAAEETRYAVQGKTENFTPREMGK